MKLIYDPAKNAKNIAERGLSFERAVDFDFETALTWVDNRKAYGETRLCSIGWLDDRLHSIAYTPRMEGLRVISFRKANTRERKRYEQEKKA